MNEKPQEQLHADTEPTADLAMWQRKLKLLNNITQSAAYILDFQKMLQTIADQLSRLINADDCFITQFDEARQTIVPMAASGRFRKEYPQLLPRALEGSLTASVLREQQVLAIEDAANSPHVSAEVTAQFGTASLLGLPLMADGKAIGAVVLTFDRPHQFSQHEIQLGEHAAAQLSLAIAKEKVLLEEREQRELAETLRDASLVLNTTLDVTGILDQLLDFVARVVPYDTASLMFVEKDEAVVVRHRGYQRYAPETHRQIGQKRFDMANNAPFRHILETRQPLLIPDAYHYPGWAKWVPHVRSWIGAPVIVNDQIVALLNVDKTEAGFYKQKHVDRLSSFAGHAAMALTNARLHEALQRQLDELAVLNAIAATCNQADDLDSLLEQATEIISQSLYTHNFGFMLLDDRGETLQVHYSYRRTSGPFRYPIVPLDEGIVGQVARTGRPFRTGDVTRVGIYLAGDPTTRSELAVPLTVTGSVVGVINVESVELDAFTEADERLLTTLADQMAATLQRLRLLASERARRQTAEILREANVALSTTLDLDEAFGTLLEFLARLVPYETAVVLLLTNRGRLLGRRQVRSSGKTMPLTGSDGLTAEQVRELFAQLRTIHIADTNEAAAALAAPPPALGDGRCWLGIPLIAGDKLIGCLAAAKAQPASFEASQLQLAEFLAAQTTGALQNIQLFAEIKQWAQQLSILHEISHQIAGHVDVRELGNTVARHLCSSLNYLSVSIFTIDHSAGEVVLQAIYGPNQELVQPGQYRQRLGQGLIGLVAESGQLALVNDTRQHEVFMPSNRIVVRSELALPLRTADTIVGVLNVDADKKDAFDENDIGVLTIAADQLAMALEKARLFEETRQRTAELEALAALSTALRAAQSLDEMLSVISQKALEVANGSLVSIFLVEAETGDLVARGVYPPNPRLLSRRYRPGQGITGQVAATGQIHVTEDMSESSDAYFLPVEETILDSVRGSIALPLRAEKRVVGVMHVSVARKHRFSEEEVRLLTAVSEIAGSAIDRILVLRTLEQRVIDRTRKLAEANERLQELDRLKSKFVSDMSHELRTPIANLALYLDLIEQGTPEKRQKYVAVLRNQAQRLAYLIEDTMNLSRVELAKDRVEFSQLALNEIVAPILTAHLPNIEVAGLVLKTSLAPDLSLVYGERNQLAQVVTNLLANAIKYTAAGGEIEVITGIDPAETAVFLTVRDSGAGIEPEDKPHLFDRFYRGKHGSQSNIPGTGLGLAIVKEIVDVHDGRIEIQSEPGRGSTFTVWLPAANLQPGSL